MSVGNVFSVFQVIFFNKHTQVYIFSHLQGNNTHTHTDLQKLTDMKGFANKTIEQLLSTVTARLLVKIPGGPLLSNP